VKKFWILSELYYPEESATGFILSQIAEGLAESRDVNVICTQPTYHQRGVQAPAQEIHHGVQIQRCRATSLNKDVLWQRMINFLTISLSIFFKALWLIGRQDIVLVVTNPPLLPFLASLVCKLKGAQCILLVHDVYPEVAVAARILKPDSLAVNVTARLTAWLYGSVDHIIVLGRDMKARALQKMGQKGAEKISIIPNWADLSLIAPTAKSENSLLQELGLTQKFVIQYAGNMGYLHNIECIIESAEYLKDQPDIHFLFLGGGTKKQWLEETVAKKQLHNVTLLPNLPRSEQNTFLNAADLAVMSFVPGMLGVSVPSRTYNILAAGKPMIVLMEAEAEVSLLLQEEAIGWVLPPGQGKLLAETIRQIYEERSIVARMGLRAREIAETQYSFAQILRQVEGVIASLDAIKAGHGERLNEQKDRSIDHANGS